MTDASTMTEDEAAKRIEKVQKLLAQAAHKNTSPEEAEVFFGKAQELMTKWAIDEQMLKLAGKVNTDEITTWRSPKIASTYFMSFVTLWDNVARANDCKVVYVKQGGPGYVLLTGFQSDVTRVQMLVTSLEVFALREAQRASTAQGGDYYFRRSFILAFANRIGGRLREQRDTTVKAAESTGTGVALALIDKRKQVDDFINATMRVRKGSSGRGTKSDWQGMNAGRAAADRAPLGNTGVNGSRGSLKG